MTNFIIEHQNTLKSQNMEYNQKWPSCANMNHAYRESDLRALTEAQEQEAAACRVTVRIDSRTLISTSPEKAEAMRRRYTEMLKSRI